jgi:O-antigen/teichoic acid export membrane protein
MSRSLIADEPPAVASDGPKPAIRRTSAQAIAKTIGSRLGWILLSGVTGMITARALGPSGRGALAAMIMWPVFLAGVLTFGLPSALIYHIRRVGHAERAGLFTAATILATVIGVVASIGGALVLPFWLSNYSPQVVRWSQWLMLFTVVSVLMLVFRSAFEALGSFGTSASTWLLAPAQTFVALFLLWRFHHLTELTAALSYVLAGVPVLLWMLLRLNRELGWNLHGFGRSSRAILSYGLRSYGIDLCGALSQSVDQAFVVGMISASEMGRYIVALSLSRTLNSVYQAAAAVLFPKCIGMTTRETVVATARITAATTALALPAAVLLCLFGSFLLRLLYGSEYVVATTLLQILSAEAILSGLTTLMSQSFMAMGRPGTVAALQGVSLAVAIPFLLLLVPKFGTIGAGIALLSTAMLRLALLLGCYVRRAGRFPQVRDFRLLVESLQAGAVLKRLVRFTERPIETLR